MNENHLTLAGRLTADPELRYTAAGAPVSTLRIAHNDRRFNSDTQQWEDAGETLFLDCAVWRRTAENSVESLRKGDAVVVTGKLKQRSYEASDGSKRTVVELDVETVLIPLDRHPVTVHRERRLEPAMAGAVDAPF